MMHEDWSGRTVLITGAGGGIGQACARMLNQLGASLVLVDRNDDALTQLSESLVGAALHRTIKSDLEGPQECNRVFELAGPLHALIHMAGIYEADDLGAENRAIWDRTIAVNLGMAFDLVGAAQSKLRSPNGARIVMATSIAYRRGSWDHLAYSASKGGIAGLVRALSRKLAPNVLVNAVAPGIIATAMPAATIAQRGDALRNEIPLKRWGTADEVAGTVVFLCSDAASYITGQIINIDGGMVNS